MQSLFGARILVSRCLVASLVCAPTSSWADHRATLHRRVYRSSSAVERIGSLIRMAEQVTFVMVPPLVLIFLVLGTIFIGVATPTEGGAMGAAGALILGADQAPADAST